MSTADERALIRAMGRRTAHLTPELRVAWITALDRLRKTMTDAHIERLVTTGRINDILTPEVLDDVLAELRRGMLKGVQEGAGTVMGLLPQNAQLVFSVRANPRVMDAIRVLDGKVLQPLKAELREAVRQAVEQGLRDGKNPREVARALRETIGLADNQLAQVANYRAALEQRLANPRASKRLGKVGDYTLRDKRYDGIVRRKDYDATKIDVMVERYTARRKAEHANTVAHNTALNANRAGADAAFRSSIDAGLVDPARAYKVWRTVGDSRVRDEHRAMNGERVRYNEAFSNGYEYPQEWGCRCIVSYRMDPAPPL